MSDGQPLGPEDNYGLEGGLLWIQQNVIDLGMCFDKREKGTSLGPALSLRT